MSALAIYWRKGRANLQSFADVWLLANIAALALVLPVGLRGLSLPRLFLLLTPRPLQRKLSNAAQFAYINKLVKFTDYVLNRNFGPLRQNCLRRSLLLYVFLRRIGVDVDVCMGVTRASLTVDTSVANVLDGHAWLLRDDQPFLEPCEPLPDLYTVTYRYPDALRAAMNNVQSASIKPEMQLLLACGRSSLTADTVPAISDLAAGAIDWSAFVDLAAAHGLINVAYSALKPHAPIRVPQKIVAQLRQQLLANAAHNTLLTHELTQLVALFTEASIDVVSYKGPVLATLLYGSVAPRQFNDLDFLVRAQDVVRAQALLLNRGYRSRLQLEWEHSFVCDNDQRMVDLHWAFTGNAFRFALDFDAVWRAAQRVTIGNKSVATLGLQDTLLLQCINGAKDDWALLSQIYEIGQFVKTYPLDWDALLVRAKSLGCLRIVRVGLWLAHKLFAAPIPARLAHAIQLDDAVRKVGEQIVSRLTGASVVGNAMSTEKTRALMRENLRDRLPIYQRVLAFIVSPNEMDRAFVPLPRRMAWLYFLVRPVRLMIKHAMNRNAATRPDS